MNKQNCHPVQNTHTHLDAMPLVNSREQMETWVGSEWNRLITRQESAVDAVKLEWLMKGSLSAADVEAAKTSARELRVEHGTKLRIG